MISSSDVDGPQREDALRRAMCIITGLLIEGSVLYQRAASFYLRSLRTNRDRRLSKRITKNPTKCVNKITASKLMASDDPAPTMRVADEMKPTKGVPTLEGVDVVADLTTLRKCTSHLLSILHRHDMITLDCEWQPQMSKVELVQLGIVRSRRVYIFDAHAFRKSPTAQSLFGQLLSRLYLQCTIVGWSAESDLENIWLTFASSQTLRRCEHVLDLQVICASRSDSPHGFGGDRLQLPSLSDACQRWLSLKLDKSMQCSDWGRRPLSPRAIEYAALDAWSLVRLVHALNVDVTRVTCWTCSLPEPLDERDVSRALGESDIGVRARNSIGDTTTLSGVLVKTLALVVHNHGRKGKRFLACVLGVSMHANFRAIASMYEDDGAESVHVRLATLKELVTIFGYVSGSLGPIGIRRPNDVRVVLDAQLVRNSNDACLLLGAGSLGRVFRATVKDLQRLIGESAVVIRPISC